MLDKLRAAVRGGISARRLSAAAGRRLAALPHDWAYLRHAGPGSDNHRKLLEYHDRHKGRRAFILGNGPSLARTDLSRLNGEISFGLNRIYLLFDETDFRPTYYACMNDLVLQQSAARIQRLSMPRFLNWRGRSLFQPDRDLIFLRERFRPHFSTDLTRGVWGGATVTFVALQIAYWMGFKEVILIGVDHHYQAEGTPHATAVAQGPDPNHFHPGYFSGGTRWHLPDLETSEMAYRLARRAFESDGRRVLDATIGGRLQIFPKVDYEELF